MEIELLNKQTGIVETLSIREYVNGIPRGIQGKLSELLELCEGNVLQNTKIAVRVKGISHTWEWETPDSKKI